jgi:hypothetical protein
VKALKIIGVVLGALLLLTGIALLAGSAVAGVGQGALDDELAKQGLAGPVKGTVTSIDQGSIFTVDYVDKQGTSQTGSGPVASGTNPPEVGDEVNVYYRTDEPSTIVILDLPGGGDIGGIGRGLRTAAIVCLIVGALLLLAGIIGLVTGRKTRAATTADQAGVPQPVAAGQSEPMPGHQYPPQPGPQDPSGQQGPPPPQYPPTA